MKLLIINGPNLNMLGIREKHLYGAQDYAALCEYVREQGRRLNTEVELYQSNHEGEIVDEIQEALGQFDGIVINPGAYTHTSIALADAVKAIAPLPVVEVHISDINAREQFRHVSYEAPYCIAQIKGHGPIGYVEAMDEILNYVKEQG